MANENLKLISVRLDPDTLGKLDEFVRRHKYWKRNTVINSILWAAMNDFNEGAVYDMTRRNHFKGQPVTAKYEIV